MITRTIRGTVLTLLEGDITTVEADVIVNAANAALAGGGGVDGAIHRAAGPTLIEECRKIGGCATGSAVATGAGNLFASYVFHAVGPVYHARPEDELLLQGAYQSCLDLAEQYQVKSIVFPSISTGAYGYPLPLAASVALKTMIAHMQKQSTLQKITFALFGGKAFTVFSEILKTLLAE